jgi:hypothetical protein
VSVFDSSEEHPPAKIRRYIITGLVFLLLVAGACWYLLRFHTEKKTINHFLSTVAAGEMGEAYKIWKPTATYSFKDFLEDWGPKGYYGPVKSYRIEDVEHLKGGSGVVVVVDVSPYQPFPDDRDFAKASKTQKVHLWVEFQDQSISFQP